MPAAAGTGRRHVAVGRAHLDGDRSPGPEVRDLGAEGEVLHGGRGRQRHEAVLGRVGRQRPGVGGGSLDRLGRADEAELAVGVHASPDLARAAAPVDRAAGGGVGPHRDGARHLDLVHAHGPRAAVVVGERHHDVEGARGAVDVGAEERAPPGTRRRHRDLVGGAVSPRDGRAVRVEPPLVGQGRVDLGDAAGEGVPVAQLERRVDVGDLDDDPVGGGATRAVGDGELEDVSAVVGGHEGRVRAGARRQEDRRPVLTRLAPGVRHLTGDGHQVRAGGLRGGPARVLASDSEADLVRTGGERLRELEGDREVGRPVLRQVELRGQVDRRTAVDGVAHRGDLAGHDLREDVGQVGDGRDVGAGATTAGREVEQARAGRRAAGAAAAAADGEGVEGDWRRAGHRGGQRAALLAVGQERARPGWASPWWRAAGTPCVPPGRSWCRRGCGGSSGPRPRRARRRCPCRPWATRGWTWRTWGRGRSRRLRSRSARRRPCRPCRQPRSPRAA